MKVSGQGRRCELCRKTVYDFTDKPVDSIAKTTTGEWCGMFLAEQIEPGLKPVEFPRSLRAAIFTIGTVLGLELNGAQAQTPEKEYKIENVADTTHAHTATPAPAINRTTAHPEASVDCVSLAKSPRKKYYLSRRFPFIVRRKIIRMGRYRY